MKKLTIALDYDLTFTADPNCFKAIIRCFQSMGHEVLIVTLRVETDRNEGDFFDELKEKYDAPTIFCDGRSKREVCDEKGIDISIWIDDNPQGIIFGSSLSFDELIQWRKEHNIAA